MDDARLRASKLQSAECHHKANAKHGAEHYIRKINIDAHIVARQTHMIAIGCTHFKCTSSHIGGYSWLLFSFHECHHRAMFANNKHDDGL